MNIHLLMPLRSLFSLPGSWSLDIDGGLHHQLPWFLGIWTQTGFPGSPDCRQKLMGLLSLHYYLSQFLSISLFLYLSPIGSAFLENSNATHVKLIFLLYMNRPWYSVIRHISPNQLSHFGEQWFQPEEWREKTHENHLMTFFELQKFHMQQPPPFPNKPSPYLGRGGNVQIDSGSQMFLIHFPHALPLSPSHVHMYLHLEKVSSSFSF